MNLDRFDFPAFLYSAIRQEITNARLIDIRTIISTGMHEFEYRLVPVGLLDISLFWLIFPEI